MGKCRGVEGYECKASPPRYSQARKEEGGCLLLFGSCPKSPEATLQGDAFEKSKITKILGIILYCWNSYYKDEGGLVPIIRTEIMTKRKFRRIY